MPGETTERAPEGCTKPSCSPRSCPQFPSLIPLFPPVPLGESQTQRFKVSSHSGPLLSSFSRQIINFRLPDSRAASPPLLPAGIPPEAIAGSPLPLRDPTSSRSPSSPVSVSQLPTTPPAPPAPGSCRPSSFPSTSLSEDGSSLADPKPLPPRLTSAHPLGPRQAQELEEEELQSGPQPHHAPSVWLPSVVSAQQALGEAGWGHTRPPPTQALFREGFWSLSSCRLRLPPAGHLNPGSHSGPDPVLLRAVAAPDVQGVERDWERLLHMMPEKTLKINTNSSLWGSETAGLPAPLGYSNPLGFPVQLLPFLACVQEKWTELGSNPSSANSICP